MNTIYESHITIDPVFGEQLSKLTSLCEPFGFKPAKLLMEKKPSQLDTFITGHSGTFFHLRDRMVELIPLLQTNGFIIRRYKIEEVMVDSRQSDIYDLLGGSSEPQ